MIDMLPNLRNTGLLISRDLGASLKFDSLRFNMAGSKHC